jgi:hypothetical protein
MKCLPCFAAALCIGALQALAPAEEYPDRTSFQSGAPYSPELDIGSDLVMVYGVNNTFQARVDQWKANGYAIAMMTGISWGQYGDYYGSGESFKKEEVQTTKLGRLYMHGDSTTVGYNVPTESYVEFIKNYIDPAIDAGVRAIFMEEPEYWAETGWSEGFKRQWERYYNEPWQAPDSSVDAQYKASRLKYELYFDALSEVFAHVKRRAAEKGITIECHVPTHSLINYAHWRIVSPESHLMDLDTCDGYIAQVWTGTSRTQNMYQGTRKERTFETAFFEYGQMLAMVRPSGRKVWFLADPIEDNPNYSWNNYRENYECTIIASLMWPEVHRFEVMPWPDRIFQGTYPKVDLDTKSGDREGIPADYATELLTVINALNHMKQDEVHYDMGTQGIGILVSDTMMFQRAEPTPSDPMLGSFYGLALPLLKQGIPLEPVQLEHVLQPQTLARYKVLLLTYEGQKPLRREYHEALAAWVRGGGALLYVGDGTDPYHRVSAWWNEEGKTDAKAYDDLFARLEVGVTAHNESVPHGEGFVRVLAEKPRQLQKYADGATRIVDLVRDLCDKVGLSFETQNYLKLERGPYLIASVLDESTSEEALVIDGNFVDLFDAQLPVRQQIRLNPGERGLYYDLAWPQKSGVKAQVAAAAARVKQEEVTENGLRFVLRGPKATTGRARVLLPGPPKDVRADPAHEFTQEWDETSSTLLLTFENAAADVTFTVDF